MLILPYYLNVKQVSYIFMPVPLSILDPPSFRLLLRGLPADSATALSKIPTLAGLAKLKSGGTFPHQLRDHPLGNTNQFHPLFGGTPKVSDLPWHEKEHC